MTPAVEDQIDLYTFGALAQQQRREFFARADRVDDVAFDVDVVSRRGNRFEHRSMGGRAINENVDFVAGRRLASDRSLQRQCMRPER